jgi:hypothetical protein
MRVLDLQAYKQSSCDSQCRYDYIIQINVAERSEIIVSTNFVVMVEVTTEGQDDYADDGVEDTTANRQSERVRVVSPHDDAR